MATKITLEFTCPFCNRTHFVETTEERLARYENGELAQIAFSDLSVKAREQIISSICPECQDEIFG